LKVSLKKKWEVRSEKYSDNLRSVLFESFPEVINQQIHKWQILNILRHIPDNSNLTILDLGCGYGRIAKEIEEKKKNVSIYGVDFSYKYVLLYKKNLSYNKKTLVGNVKQIPIKDAYFDIVVMVSVLMYLLTKNDQKMVVNEIKRILKPNGSVILIENNKMGFNLLTGFGIIPKLKKLIGDKKKVISKEKIFRLYEIDELFNQDEWNKGIKTGCPFLTGALVPLYLISKVSQKLVAFLSIFLYNSDCKFAKWTLFSLYICHLFKKK